MDTVLALGIIAVLLAALLGGGLAGGLVAWWYSRPLPEEPATDTTVTDRLSDEDIDQAAAQWAEAHGQPTAAPLIAGKLRLGRHLIGQRRGRWSRW